MSGLITVASLPGIAVDVASLDSAATELKDGAALVGPATGQAETAWNGLHESYQTPERWALVAKMSVVESAGTDFSETLVSVAETLALCAEELAGAERRLEQLRTEIPLFRASVLAYREDQAELLDLEDAGGSADVWGPGQYEQHLDLLAEREAVRTAIDTALDQARADLSKISDPVGLGGAADAAALGTSWTTRQHSFEGDLSTAMLNRLALSDPSEVSALLSEHPAWVDHLREHPPEPDEVLAWWDGLGEPGSSTWSATQSALMLGAPVVVGALGGVPPLARVEANRENARREVARLQAELDEVAAQEEAAAATRYDSYSFGHVPTADEVENKSRMNELQRQIDYLTKAIEPRKDGTYAVQLFLYDHEHSRIVEMIGTPGPTTSTTVTYSPGTGTTESSFYGGGVQQVARYLTKQDPNTVAFVWKDGEFPGGGPSDDTVTGILDANDPDIALAAGERLARFQTEVQSDPVLGSTYDVGIGHSWGLAAVTSSEVHGAQYDQVESLAGAYVPPGWGADPSTQYSHQTYTDFLSIFQDLGFVGEGRNPDVTEPFASSSKTHERQGDHTWHLPRGSTVTEKGALSSEPRSSIEVTTAPVDNHNLITRDTLENLFVLEAIEARRQKGLYEHAEH